MANAVVGWAKENPVLAGGAAIGVVLIVLLFAGSGESAPEGDSGGMGAAGTQAYYAAVARQSQAGAAIQVAQIQSQAETNRALIAATYGLETNKVNAGVAMRGYDVETLRIGAEERNNRGWVDAWREVEINRVNQEANVRNNSINLANAALGQRSLGKAQRGAIVQAGITGQVVPVSFKPIDPGASPAGIINAVGNVAGKVLPFI